MRNLLGPSIDAGARVVFEALAATVAVGSRSDRRAVFPGYAGYYAWLSRLPQRLRRSCNRGGRSLAAIALLLALGQAPALAVPPNADAGPDQNAFVLTLVTLNGSGSNDPDDGPNPLTFQWTFVSIPAGSTLTNSDIGDATAATASFIPDVPGDYLLRLDVFDGEAPASDEVVVTVQPVPPTNVPPNADAGLDQNTVVPTPVTLNGSGSNDPDNGPNPLIFQWTFVSIPAGSTLTNSGIADATTATASFIPDVPGDYLLRLDVSDGVDAAFDQVVVTVQTVPPLANVPPNAAAGPDQNAVVLTLVTLSGSGSDPDNGPNPLILQWTFVSIPAGSALTNIGIADATTATASFIPDVPGDYELRLDVSDGVAAGFDEVVVTVQLPTPINVPPTASNVLISGIAEVGQVLSASYDYADAENDPQGASTFRWLRTNGEVDTSIDGATDRTYTLVAADEGTLIKFEVTPVAQRGASPGLPASAVVGPIGPLTVIPSPGSAPTASNVLIAGTPRVGQVLTGSYTYADAEGDLQGTSIFRWLRNDVVIPGATARSYALVAADEGTLIKFEVTPVAQSGPSPGLAASAEVGPVTAAPDPPTPQTSDLELFSLTATPDSLTVNGQLTYTITVRNNGPAAATGVRVIDALPPGAAPVSAEGPADSSQGQCSSTPSPGPEPQALTVECHLDTLAPAAEATVTINVMPTVPGELSNTAHVVAIETDPNLANNSKTVPTAVRLPVLDMADLAVTVVVDPRANGFRYTLTVTNHGRATATRVRLTNDLPRDIDIERIIPEGSCGDTDPDTDPVLCDLGALATGAVATVTIDSIFRTGVDPDTLPNRAAVNGDQDDPDRTNNSALTSALELPRPQTACNSTRCALRLTCNPSDLLERRCDNQVITVLVKDTRARRDTRAGRLSDERAAKPPRIRFAAASRNFPAGQTNVRLKLTSKGKKLARTLTRQGKKKLKGVMEIRNHVGGMGTDIIRITVRLK